MRFGMVLPNLDEGTLKLARQIGVSDIVTSLGDHEGGGTGVWDFQKVLVQFRKIADAGLFWSVIEGMPVTDRVKLGLPGRDQDIEHWQESLRVVGAVGIPIVCYNWMAAFGWLRTSFTTRVRGDALATSYNHEQMQRGPLSEYGIVPEEQLWDALEYFLKAVVPVAEEAGVQLAMHPDDPPLSPIRGMGRIMTSPESFQRMIDLVPSPANGLTFCQGCFAEMGVDVCASIRHFGQQGKLFFAHFRNLRGLAANFTEAFHDDGDTDMYAAMRAYYDVGFAGPMRPDHVPTLEGDTNTRPGYSLWGRLYAIGYMRGLAEAVEKSR